MREPASEAFNAAIGRFRTFQSGVVCDAMGRLDLTGWMTGVGPLSGNPRLVGPARTLRFGPRRGAETPPTDMYTVIRSLAPGDVLVIGTDECESWIFGENVAHTALYQGLAGIVTDAAARDGAELAQMRLPCFARGLATRPPSGIELVAFDAPISCAGAQVASGDLIVGDADGIVVVPGGKITDVLVQAEDLDELEKAQESAIARKAPLDEIAAILRQKKKRK